MVLAAMPVSGIEVLLVISTGLEERVTDTVAQYD